MAGLAQICHSAEISHLSVTEVRTLIPSLGLNSAAAAGAATEAEGQPDIPEPLQLILGGTSSSHQHTSASTFPGTDTSGSRAYQHREHKHQSKPRGSRWIQLIIPITHLLVHSFIYVDIFYF